MQETGFYRLLENKQDDALQLVYDLYKNLKDYFKGIS